MRVLCLLKVDHAWWPKPPGASGEMESVAADRTTNVSSNLVLVLSYTSRAWMVKAACIPAVAYESPSPIMPDAGPHVVVGLT